jgi:hypothetical protein
VTAVPALAVVPSDGGPAASAVSRLAGRVASALVQEGASWPALAAACLAARGIAGDLDQPAWALRLALPLPVVEAAEAGALPPDHTPAVLMAVADQAWATWRTWPA